MSSYAPKWKLLSVQFPLLAFSLEGPWRKPLWFISVASAVSYTRRQLYKSQWINGQNSGWQYGMKLSFMVFLHCNHFPDSNWKRTKFITYTSVLLWGGVISLPGWQKSFHSYFTQFVWFKIRYQWSLHSYHGSLSENCLPLSICLITETVWALLMITFVCILFFTVYYKNFVDKDLVIYLFVHPV